MSTGTTIVSVAATKREDIEKIFNIFERDALSARQPSSSDKSDELSSLTRDEPSFTMSRAIPALFVSKDLVEAVRITYLERIKKLLAEEQEKYEEPEMSITIEDEIGIAAIKSMKDFAPAKFADSTRAIRLRYDGTMHGLYNQRIDISFTTNRATSELDLTTSGSTARESAEGIVQQLFSIMEANRTNGEWRNPKLHHQFFAYVALLCVTFWMIINVRNVPWAAQVSISVGSVLTLGFLIITPKFRPYIEFDTRRTKMRREWSATISKTFWSVVVVGTIAAIFKDYILRQLGLK